MTTEREPEPTELFGNPDFDKFFLDCCAKSLGQAEFRHTMLHDARFHAVMTALVEIARTTAVLWVELEGNLERATAAYDAAARQADALLKTMESAASTLTEGFLKGFEEGRP